MLIYSFICSIIFSVVMVTFILASFFAIFKQKKMLEESEEMLNGFKTYDLNASVGGVDDSEEKE